MKDFELDAPGLEEGVGSDGFGRGGRRLEEGGGGGG
jgi:hypothetical protein